MLLIESINMTKLFPLFTGTQCTPSRPEKNNGDNLNRFGHQDTINQERFNYFDTDLLKVST